MEHRLALSTRPLLCDAAQEIGKRDDLCIGCLNDGIQSFFDLARQHIQQFVLLLLRKLGKDVIKQARGGADEPHPEVIDLQGKVRAVALLTVTLSSSVIVHGV